MEGGSSGVSRQPAALIPLPFLMLQRRGSRGSPFGNVLSALIRAIGNGTLSGHLSFLPRLGLGPLVAFCLVIMSLGSQTFCLLQIFVTTLSFSLVCFPHPQGGRDESNFLDDALMRQDAQVSRTAASFFSCARKTVLHW